MNNAKYLHQTMEAFAEWLEEEGLLQRPEGEVTSNLELIDIFFEETTEVGEALQSAEASAEPEEIPEGTYVLSLSTSAALRMIAIVAGADERFFANSDNRAMIHQCRAWMEKMDSPDVKHIVVATREA